LVLAQSWLSPLFLDFGYGQIIRALRRASVAVSLKALPAKPVALAPVWATVKIGVHTYPFLPTKRGGITPTLRERNPLKKAKKRGFPRLLAWLVLFGL